MQEQLEIWFGPSGATAARYVIAFVVVLVLLFVLRWVVRRYMGGPIVRGGRSRQPRLAVMDVAVVDARRRLVLVRRDNIEHLVMIGGPTDIVIEQTIVRGVPVGTMGRMPMRPSQAGDAVAESDPTAAAKDAGARPPVAGAAPSGSGRAPAPPPPPVGAAAAAGSAATAPTAAAATGFRHAPEPVVARAADEPARPQPPVRPVRSLDVTRQNRGPDRTMARPLDRPVDRRTEQPGEQPGGGPAAELPRRFEPAGSTRGGQDAPTVTPLSRATPVVPPEPARPVIVEDEIAAAVPAAPLVAPQEPSVRPLSANVPNVASPRPEKPPAFDDLARRLDEALQLDLNDETPAPSDEPRREFTGRDRDAARARPDQRQEPVLSPEARAEPRPEPPPIPYVRPTRGPAARAENEPSEIVNADIPAPPPPIAGDVAAPTPDDAPAANKPAPGDRPASVLGAASAWFRSRPSPASSPVGPPVETASVDAPAADTGADRLHPQSAATGAPEAVTPVAGKPRDEPPLLSRAAGRPVGTRFSDPSARSTSGAAEPAREPQDRTEATPAPPPEPAAGEESVTTASGPVLDGEPTPKPDRPDERRDGRSATALDVSSRLADDLARILEVEPLEPADSLGPVADDDKPVLSPAPTPATESKSAPAAPLSRPADVATVEPDARPSDQELEIGPDGRLKPETAADTVAAGPDEVSGRAVTDSDAVTPPSDVWDVEPAGAQAPASDEAPAEPSPAQAPDQPAEDAVSPDDKAKPGETRTGPGAAASGAAEGAETAPEPVIDQPPRSDDSKAPPVVTQTPAKKPGSDFSSLEDEMARLLDELAGDSRSRR